PGGARCEVVREALGELVRSPRANETGYPVPLGFDLNEVLWRDLPDVYEPDDTLDHGLAFHVVVADEQGPSVLLEERALVEGLQVNGVEVDLVQLEAFLGTPSLRATHDSCRLELQAGPDKVRLCLVVQLV